MQDKPTPLDEQRIKAAQETQDAAFKLFDKSGLPLEVKVAIAFNILVSMINVSWDRKRANRGSVINLMTGEMRSRLQKFLPKE